MWPAVFLAWPGVNSPATGVATKWKKKNQLAQSEHSKVIGLELAVLFFFYFNFFGLLPTHPPPVVVFFYLFVSVHTYNKAQSESI